jgi:type II secretory pathway pseudopilin PulG
MPTIELIVIAAVTSLIGAINLFRFAVQIGKKRKEKKKKEDYEEEREELRRQRQDYEEIRSAGISDEISVQPASSNDSSTVNCPTCDDVFQAVLRRA